MTLYLIGLGLGNEKSLSLHALEIIKKCKTVYLENYTSKLDFKVNDLNKLINKKVIVADRSLVEGKAEQTILRDASKENIAFLVPGDVFSATTHIDLVLRARKLKIKIKIINNASVITAVGITGLSLYKFGATTSIPFDNEHIKSPLEIIKNNLKINLHTLILLDLNPEENKYMTINEALTFLLKKGMENKLCVGCSALGSEEPEIKIRNAKDLLNEKFKKFPQCLIVVGKLNFKEKEALGIYKNKRINI